jgi:hypothetical protein
MKKILNAFKNYKVLFFVSALLLQPLSITTSHAFDTKIATSSASILPACSTYGDPVDITDMLDDGKTQCTTASKETNIRIYKVWFCSAANPPITPLSSLSRAADVTGCFNFFNGNFYPTISADGGTSGTPTGTINAVPPGKYKYIVLELDHVTRFRAALAVKMTSSDDRVVGSKEDNSDNTTYIANEAYCNTVGGSYSNDLTNTTSKDTIVVPSTRGAYSTAIDTNANTSCSSSTSATYSSGGGISAVTLNCYNISEDGARDGSSDDADDRTCDEWDGGFTSVYGTDTLNFYLYKPFDGNIVCDAISCSGVRRHFVVQTLGTEIGDEAKSTIGFDVSWNVTQGAILDVGQTCNALPCKIGDATIAQRVSFRQGPFFMKMKFLFD